MNMDFNDKRVLITGGAGFIGSNLVFHLQNKFPSVQIVIFDSFRSEERLSNGNRKSFGSYSNLIGFEGTLICGDLNNKSDIDVLRSYRFDYIFHQAAISDTRVYDQELIFRTNVNSFYSILELTKQSGSVLVYASSAAQYGQTSPPQKVGFENPSNPYGYSKYAMDQIARKFMSENEDLRVIGLRYFNVYGPKEFYKETTASMVLQLAFQILRGSRPKLFVGSDKICRDFIFIDDVIQANLLACHASKSGVYNVGSGIARSFQDIADILLVELGSDLSIEFIDNPYSDYQTHTQADVTDSQSSLGFEAKFTLESGIKAYIPSLVQLFEHEVKKL